MTANYTIFYQGFRIEFVYADNIATGIWETVFNNELWYTIIKQQDHGKT